MNAREFVTTISGFAKKQHPEKVLLFAWYLQTQREMLRFSAADISRCYHDADLPAPANPNQSLTRLAGKRNAPILKDRDGYRLAQPTRARLDATLGGRAQAQLLTSLLSSLPQSVPTVSEREFLLETLECYKVGANRAAIVMGWNLAYDHLCGHILAIHLSAFNQALSNWSKKSKPIKVRTDLEVLKEADVVRLARTANAITKNQHTILNEKLRKRNMAAHPSQVVFTPAQAEEVIIDLVHNIVIALS